MTKRIAIIAITAAALLLTEQGAASAAPPIPTPRQIATSDCKDQRAQRGPKKFRKIYGKKAMRKCIRKQIPMAVNMIATAGADCDDELAELGFFDFLDEYEAVDVATAHLNCVLSELDFSDDPTDGADA